MKTQKLKAIHLMIASGLVLGMVACPTVGYAASSGGAVFHLITNDGKADRKAMAKKMIDQRMKEKGMSPKAKVLPIAKPKVRQR